MAWLMFLTLGCGGEYLIVSAPPEAGSRTQAIVEHCKNLRPLELYVYLKELGDRNDLASLTAVSRANFPGNSMAVEQIVRILETDKVVGYCRSLEVDSPHWQQAVLVLDYHPKQAVIGYIREMATSPIPIVRYYCYRVCMRAGWDDLVNYAELDLNNTSYVGFVPNQSDDEVTICQVAQKYLRSLEGRTTSQTTERNSLP